MSIFEPPDTYMRLQHFTANYSVRVLEITMTTVWLLLLVVVIASSQRTIDNDVCVTNNCEEHVKDIQMKLEYQQQLLQTITSRLGKSEPQ